MGREVNLMINYPRDKPGPLKFSETKALAGSDCKSFDESYFDGKSHEGYGGLYYQPNHWKFVAQTLRSFYGLTSKSTVLEIGCAKGFLLHDLMQEIPGIKTQGIDISQYAIENVMDSVKEHVQVADAQSLPFKDQSFDLVISTVTLDHLSEEACKKALQEIGRVSKAHSFVTMHAYRNEKEEKYLHGKSCAVKTIKHTQDWVKLFERAGYHGDYHWCLCES